MDGPESVQVIATLVAAIAILGWVINSLVSNRKNGKASSSHNPGTISADIGLIKERLTSIVESNKRQEDSLGRIERNMLKK